MKAYILAAASVVLFVASNVLATEFGSSRRIDLLLICGVVATVGFACFGLISTVRGLAAMSAVVDILVVVGSVLFGVFVRREALTGMQIAGIVLGIFATSMILLGGGQSTEQL